MVDTGSPKPSAAKGASNIAGSLKKQIGPLPLGVWIALIVGGVGVTYYLNRNRGTAPSSNVPNEVVDPTGGTYGTAGATAGTSPSTTPPSIETNEQWAVAAIKHLIARGYDATNADTAIRKYIAAAELSIQERALVNDALTFMGPPPSPLAPAPDTPGSTPEPTTPPNPPSGLRVQEWSRDGINVNIKWNPVQGATSYRVFLAGGLDVLRFVAETTGTAYVVKVGRGAPWRYGVTAVNGKGESQPTTIVFDNSKG